MMVVEAIALYLHEQGIVQFDQSGVLGDTFIGVVPAQPDEIVVLTPSGGPAPDPSDATDEPSFQVRTRAGRDPRPAYMRQLAIYGALHGAGHVTLPGGLEMSGCLAMQSDPVSMGADENGRIEYVMNYRCWVRRPTAHRT